MDTEKQKDLGKFFLVGVVSTIFDYTLLNIFISVAGLPLLVANSISAPFSSYLSYKLNKRVVFEDRMHGKRKTLLLYVGIIGFGILVIQNSLLHLLDNTVAQSLAETVQPVVAFVKLDLDTSTIAVNIAKVGASLIAALWNFYMLRRFVFVTREDVAS
jgi:putative flippase GtrA